MYTLCIYLRLREYPPRSIGGHQGRWYWKRPLVQARPSMTSLLFATDFECTKTDPCNRLLGRVNFDLKGWQDFWLLWLKSNFWLSLNRLHDEDQNLPYISGIDVYWYLAPDWSKICAKFQQILEISFRKFWVLKVVKKIVKVNYQFWVVPRSKCWRHSYHSICNLNFALKWNNL